MSKRFIGICAGLLVLIWGAFFCWKHFHKAPQQAMTTTRPLPADGQQAKRDLPLTDLRIKNKIIRLDAVKEGELAQARYTLYNTGDSPLLIEYVNPDCSCTGYEVSDSIAQPGDSLQITLKFNSAGKAGTNLMSTVLKANTPTALYKLSFVVNVLEKTE